MATRWLRNPWVIGIMTGIIAIAVCYYVFGIGKPASSVATNSANTTFQTSSLSPEDIVDRIAGLPPYQQAAARQSYDGLPVTWAIEFFSIDDISNQYYVTATTPLIGGPLVRFPVNLEDYPQFRVLPKGQKFTVQGTIVSMDALSIDLENCTVYFK